MHTGGDPPFPIFSAKTLVLALMRCSYAVKAKSFLASMTAIDCRNLVTEAEMGSFSASVAP